MSAHTFNLRLDCQYEGEDNKVAGLNVEVLADGQWQPLRLDVGSPGFLLFVYTIFTCQHLYLRVNAAERGLLLESAAGTIEVGAGEDWMLEQLHVDFEVRLASGSPSADDVDYITGRMQQCPVSKNLKLPADSYARLKFT